MFYRFISSLAGIFCMAAISGQSHLLTHFRIPVSEISQIRYVDPDNDGDPDLLYCYYYDTIPALWIDDDDDMQYGDIEGDNDSDCLVVDFNNDSVWGGPLDIIIDWNDEDGDNIADMQVFIEQTDGAEAGDGCGRPEGHYMWVIDTDKDKVFNFIDWRKFAVKAWERSGHSNFFKDYHGHSLFLKVHAATFNIEDLTLNWENPFLFYDPDNDGLTEYTIRFAENIKPGTYDYAIPSDGDFSDIKRTYNFTGMTDWAAISYDLDNDNAPGNECDFDITIHFRGKGFSSEGFDHEYKSLKGFTEANHLFYDPRFRQMDKLTYIGHEDAKKMMYEKGEWDKVYLVFDEDDDCNRWERVELYNPLDPFVIEPGKGGISNPSQSDITGDRGEWDMDNSGKGQLYVAPFDGRIHLFGAEKGYWRIDQHAKYFQGWGGWQWEGTPRPEKFATVEYIDKDNNGFFDQMNMDLDGDTIYEYMFDLVEIGMNDSVGLYDFAGMEYDQINKWFMDIAEKQYQKGLESCRFAEAKGISTNWYSFLKNPRSTSEKYKYGYWLSLYTFIDLLEYAEMKGDKNLKDAAVINFLTK